MQDSNLAPEQWEQELCAAGWKKRPAHVWEAPNGALLRGPYHAWVVMKSLKDGEAPMSEWTIQTISQRP